MFIGLVLAIGISVAIPFFTEDLLKAFANADPQLLITSAVWLLIVEVSHSLIHIAFWGTTSGKLQTKVTQNIRHNLIESTINLKNKNFDLHGSGQLIQIVSNDTASLSFIYNKLMDVIISILSKLAIFIYIFILNPYLGLYCGLEIAVVYWINSYRLKCRVIDKKVLNEINDKNTGLVTEIIKGSRDIKRYNIQKNILEIADDSLSQLQKVGEKSEKTQYILWRVNIIVQSIMFFAFIPFCLLLINNNITTFEVAFVVFVFKRNITGILSWIVECLDNAKDGGIYAKRIFHLLEGFEEGFELFPAFTDTTNYTNNLDIEIKDLTFAYDDKNYVLENFNLYVKENTKVALVGESGSGKSSILNLLNKSYDIEKGKIFISGIDVCDYCKDQLRNMIAIVPQDPYIFNFTIKENLKIIKPNASDDEIELACKEAQIHDFILSLPNGYETQLGEGGVLLSGGQRQRLSIARAFLKDCPIMIFDEATSALDNENQQKIKDIIDQISKNKTVIIVAHRLSTIIDTDVIHFIKDKQIVASGTHKELLETCSEYSKLYNNEQ